MKTRIKKKYRYSKPVTTREIKGIICQWSCTSTGRLYVEGMK